MDEMSNSNLDVVMNKLGLSGDPNDFDSRAYLSEREELQEIANSLPDDGVLDVNNVIRLQRLCIRGMNICDDWIPRLHVLMTVYEVKRDRARSTAYSEAKTSEGAKLTVEGRKAVAEGDETFNEMKLMVERIKGSKIFHEKKKETLKSAYYMFRDQLVSYKISDKGNTGEELEFTNTTEKGYGKVAW